ncbi:hypothetical protein ABZ832_12500 [Streptantibioticus parmotrematis]|uniref:hypothetical protein n=1 Tax=Streptantibioticus parmotrematis TaxID=2873249 RepID=UPI0033E02311
MPDATALDQADAMIEEAWGRPLDELEILAVQHPAEDPLLRSAMHIRSSLVVYSNAAAVHQERLHALTRTGRVPTFYDNERITTSATDLRVALAESRVALQAINHVIATRATTQKNPAPTDRLTRTAVARSSAVIARTASPSAARPATASAQHPPARGPGRRGAAVRRPPRRRAPAWPASCAPGRCPFTDHSAC